jgi:hypothetical protein
MQSQGGGEAADATAHEAYIAGGGSCFGHWARIVKKQTRITQDCSTEWSQDVS